jgi:hypothetical protein
MQGGARNQRRSPYWKNAAKLDGSGALAARFGQVFARRLSAA